MPFLETGRLLRAVISAVDFDRRQARTGIFQLALLRQALGIEGAAPVRVNPAANANMDAHAPFLRMSIITIKSVLLGSDESPGDAKRILALGIAIAPEHVFGLHVAGAAGVHRPLPPGIYVLDRQHQGKTGGRNI